MYPAHIHARTRLKKGLIGHICNHFDKLDTRIAIDIFRQCGADGWVTKYEKKLAGL